MGSASGNVELQWVCSRFKDLLYRCWEGEYFLFNPNTGHTHVLNQFSWDILSICAERPRSEPDLLAFCAEASAQEQEQESLVESLDIHLDHLAQLGFIETVEIHALH